MINLICLNPFLSCSPYFQQFSHSGNHSVPRTRQILNAASKKSCAAWLRGDFNACRSRGAERLSIDSSLSREPQTRDSSPYSSLRLVDSEERRGQRLPVGLCVVPYILIRASINHFYSYDISVTMLKESRNLIFRNSENYLTFLESY